MEHSKTSTGPPSIWTTRPEPGVTPKILLCLDRSELSETILSYAVMLTKAVTGTLTLMHVVETSGENHSSSHEVLLWELKHREARQYMEQVLKRIEGLDVAVDLQIAEGRAAEQILCFMRQNPVDFVILASHGTHGLTEWSLSSTAAKIIGRTHSSFVVVPSTPVYQQSELEPVVRRILVPLDDSVASQTCLPIVLRIARQQGAELVLAHAIEPVGFSRLPGISRADQQVIKAASSILETAARNYFDLVSQRLRNEGLEVSVVIKSGLNPIALMTDIIDSMNIDFVAMTAHGASRSEDYPLGRMSAHMASHTPVPLLIVQDLERDQMVKALKRRRYDRAPLRSSKSAAGGKS